MKYRPSNILRTLIVLPVLFCFGQTAIAGEPGFASPYFTVSGKAPADTTPVQDRRGDPYTYQDKNPFSLKDTSFIKRTIEYDPVTRQYYIVEKIGNQYYRTPTSFTQQEFLSLQGKRDEADYFRKRADLLFNLNRRNYKPKFNFVDDWVNRIVGNGKIEIKPSGYVDILAGYQGQRINNPTLPERARNNGGFDFNMNAQLQIDGNIGDKLKLPINYNTLANFNFENQLKLDYKGGADEILKSFEAGNVSFNSKGTLIPSATELFGLKTQMQFGKLFVTTVLANQRSQRQTMGLQGGSSIQPFSIKADEYEENRHFLMSQYFRNNYNTAMKQLPVVNSRIQVLRVEVWVTNRTGATTDTRDIVALMDLGEGNPYGPWGGLGNIPPRNNANNLYGTVVNTPNARSSTSVQSVLTGLGLQPVQDFEKTFARKLQPTDYYFNPQIGFISLNQPLQPDEVLGIAFQYTYNGQVYQVGEFSTDVPPDPTATTQPVIFLKLLKATSQRTNLPIWNLMMKNVYSVGFGILEKQGFEFNIYYDEPSLGEKRYLPADDVSDPYKGQPLISLLNADRLNNQNDPQPDGQYDFVEGFTVLSQQSRIIFPVLEPFGKDLEYVYNGPDSAVQRQKYLFYPLYDTIRAIASTFANLNRFKLNGRSRSASQTDYQLGFNIPKGSVTVTAGGQVLRENIDYEINYDLGTLRIINQAIINSGLPVSVNYENNALFGIQNRSFMAARFDYLVNKKLTIGGTFVKLSERPFFIKQSYGEDPVRNVMLGADFDYRSEFPRLSKWLDKLPGYTSNGMSNITAYGEFAELIPGHAKQIGKGGNGVVYIDDFEGSKNSIDLRFPLTSWTLSSTPQKSPDVNGNILFPEAELSNDLSYGYNRAKLAWYNIETVLQEPRNTNNPLRSNLAELSKPETRQILQREVFPNRSTDFGQSLLTTFDMAYYPTVKGPYNFEYRPGRVDANGKLLNPREAWGGIMRNIDQTDFETGNVEFIEFWLKDPFTNKPGSTGGQLYFQLGNISEDILKDGKRLYENGLPTPSNPNIQVDNSSVWGRTPLNPIQVTNAFSNDPADRPYQDVGYDGLPDSSESQKFAGYLNNLLANFGANSPIYQKAVADPSGDNFVFYRDDKFTATDGILKRYQDFNNPNGNSPVASANSQYISAFTLYPDQEELNRDNTLNETEEYFQYQVDLKPNMLRGTNFITDRRDITVSNLPDGSGPRTETWYLFRVPVSEFQAKVGNIPDFKSIRFIRMFLTGFEDTTVLRFGKLELVRNNWRRFNYELDTTGQFKTLPANSGTTTEVLAVNLEENDRRQPIRYVIPPGIERQQQLSNNNALLFLNEQSISLKVCDLQRTDARGVFKTMNLDLRQYGRMQMFVHAESVISSADIQDNELNAVIRIGSDFATNYYEVKVPLKMTQWGATDSLSIWPEANNLDFNIPTLTSLKMRRNTNGVSPGQYYSEVIDGKTFAIIGNPDLGEVRGILLAVQNATKDNACTEVWFNELRLSKLDEKGGWAAVGRVDIGLSDLGNLSISGNAKSAGFGTLEQKVNERSREDFKQFDIATNLDLGKFFPRKTGIQIPVYAGISKTTSTPEYDPYSKDLLLKDVLNSNPTGKDSIRNNAIDQTTIRTLNFTNVKKNRTGDKKPQLWDISNLEFNFSHTKTERHNPLIENEELKRTRGALGYNFTPQPRFIEPFKKMIKSKSKWFSLLKDFNINPVPSQLSFKADVFRQFGATRPRNIGGGPYKVPETYDKFFTFDRYYIFSWDITRSFNVDFSATNNARVDEPAGRIDTKQKKDSVRSNLFDGGRTTRYHQEATFTYNLPTAKLPLLDWTTVRATYKAQYDWIGSSILPEAKSLGNTITNGQTKSLNGELNFDQLYNKSKFIRRATTPEPVVNNNSPVNDSLSRQIDSLKKKLETKKLPAKEKRKTKRKLKKLQKLFRKLNKQPRQVPGMVKTATRLATSLKRIGVQYTENSGTDLPGYLDSTVAFGQNWRSMNPGLGFVLGYQPDTSWINKIGNKGLLTRDPIFNALIQQRYDQRLGITAQISPVRDLNIDLNLDKQFSKNYSELIKDTSGTDGLRRYNPYAMGSFSISYISYQTLFTKFDPNVVSETFKQFETNRLLLSQKLKDLNPYASGNTQNPDGYFEGYTRYAQDILIPSFLGAYTKKDPLSIKLVKNNNPGLKSNPFSGLLPKPNWNVTYNGLSRIPGLDKIFASVTIRHGYSSTLSMNNFNSALFFQDPLHYGFPSFIDTLTGNYIPFFLVPNITISENFGPLFSVDMTFTNQLSTRVEYRKTRQLSLSLVDYQLAENRSNELIIGADWRVRGMPLIKKIGKMKLENDVTFKLDFSIRDDATANSKLDQNSAFGTAGQKVIRINPTIDYVVNSRVRATLYFEQTRNIPKIATSAPVTNTRAGLQLRISLAQ